MGVNLKRGRLVTVNFMCVSIFFFFKIFSGTFRCGSSGKGSSVVTAVAQVTVVTPVQSLTRELPHAVGKKRKKKKIFSF